jgi:hypothetical protein
MSALEPLALPGIIAAPSFDCSLSPLRFTADGTRIVKSLLTGGYRSVNPDVAVYGMATGWWAAE